MLVSFTNLHPFSTACALVLSSYIAGYVFREALVLVTLVFEKLSIFHNNSHLQEEGDYKKKATTRRRRLQEEGDYKKKAITRRRRTRKRKTFIKNRNGSTVFPRSEAATATINFPLLVLAATFRGWHQLLYTIVYCLAASILIMSCSKVPFLVVIIVS